MTRAADKQPARDDAAATIAGRIADLRSLIGSTTTGDVERVERNDIRDFAEASTQDTAAYAAFFHAMLDQGVYLPPSAYEAWFVSAAHDERAVATIVDALPAAAAAAASAGTGGQ